MYEDVPAAIDWLGKIFGFEEHYRYGDPPDGAQMHLGNAWIMLRKARPGSASPAQIGCETQSLTVFVEDVDERFQHLKDAGARIVEQLHEPPYGELQFAALDLEGHHWLFSRHVRDVAPSDWGARVVHA